MSGPEDDEKDEKVLASHQDPMTDQDDGFTEEDSTLAYLSQHPRLYYARSDDRFENALAHVNPERAVTFLRRTHGVLAGQEALIRALLAERQHHRQSARYWIEIYERLISS